MRRSERRRARSGEAAPRQRAAAATVNPYHPIEVLSEDQVEAIHDASLRVLEELGVEVLSEQALTLLASAGADVERASGRVRFDRALVEQSVAQAPARFTLHARDAARDRVVGDNRITFALVASAPFCSDLDGGRRTGNFADFSNLLRLGQSLNVIDLFCGYPVEPVDLPVPTRHLDCHHAFVTLTDRAWHVYSLGGGRVTDALEMVRIARGIDREQLRREPSLTTVANVNSPRRLDEPMAEGIIEMARNGQVVIVTPFTLAGAMSPVTLAGALAQQNAEALAGITLAQLAAPGAPVMYGGFTSNVDMKTGAPAFGTPEYTRAALAGGQLARRYGIPYRSSNANAANLVGAQAAYESQMSLWGAVMGHANLVIHAAGWLEGGLTASYEKVVVDAEMLQMMAEFLQPIVVDEDTLALDAIAEVEPGGHFFGAAHTLARYENAFYEPILSDRSNFEAWTEAGARSTAQRANRIWKRLLEEYQAPPLDAAVEEALQDYMARRRPELLRG